MSSTSRELGDRVMTGLEIMRDEDDDENGWVLPNLATIGSAIQALGDLVRQGEDRYRFKVALTRIEAEWTERSGYTHDDIRQFIRSVIEGGSARVPIGRAKVAEASAMITSPTEEEPCP